jgi:hypothetical protein
MISVKASPRPQIGSVPLPETASALPPPSAAQSIYPRVQILLTYHLRLLLVLSELKGSIFESHEIGPPALLSPSLLSDFIVH